MGVESSRARVADLHFRVFDRTIHPDWFATRVHRRSAREQWEADVRIIDEGHVITYRSGAVRVTEVLCGPETPLPEPGLLFQSMLRRERSTSLCAGGVVDYQSCLEVERVDREIFSHLCDEMLTDASRNSLVHHVPTTNRLLPAPLSYLHVESRVRGLTVHAFHTFPVECAIVRSHSLFELR